MGTIMRRRQCDLNSRWNIVPLSDAERVSGAEAITDSYITGHLSREAFDSGALGFAESLLRVKGYGRALDPLLMALGFAAFGRHFCRQRRVAVRRFLVQVKGYGRALDPLL